MKLWRWLKAAVKRELCPAKFYPAAWRNPRAVDRHFCDRWAHHPGEHMSIDPGRKPFRWS